MEPSLDLSSQNRPTMPPWETRDWVQTKFPSTEVVQTALRSRVELARALAPAVAGPPATVVYPPAVPDPRELRDKGPVRPGVLVLEHSPSSGPLRSALAWVITGEGAGASVVVGFAFALLLWAQRNAPRLVTGAAVALAAPSSWIGSSTPCGLAGPYSSGSRTIRTRATCRRSGQRRCRV